jgi:hypothetical protein
LQHGFEPVREPQFGCHLIAQDCADVKNKVFSPRSASAEAARLWTHFTDYVWSFLMNLVPKDRGRALQSFA